MEEIVIISGKGGTGKTTITASFAVIAESKVIVDADVDAANLHLLLHPEIKEVHKFKGGKKAVIDSARCVGCGRCEEVCRFGAPYEEGRVYCIDEFSCEGCGACALVCPREAIKMEIEETGKYFISETEYGPFVHAELGIAQENSGKLVSVVREKAKDIAIRRGFPFVIIDGPPGIGCPVIASLTGVRTALVVTESTLSGIHDMKRIIEVAFHFGVKVYLCINKYDLNEGITSQIEEYAKNNGIEVIGKIPYEERVIEAVRRGVPPVKFLDGEIPNILLHMWERIKEG